jgi:hypothetical protein
MLADIHAKGNSKEGTGEDARTEVIKDAAEALSKGAKGEKGRPQTKKKPKSKKVRYSERQLETHSTTKEHKLLEPLCVP